MKNQLFTVFFAVNIALVFSCSEPKYPESMTPEESMETFQFDDRFEIQVFAAEPMVKDPVSMIFDEKGDIYVVEMPDYPFQPEDGVGEGLVKKLMDTNGDGVIDDYVVFADNIMDATSMLPWKDGLLITAAPHIWYFKDTNGDGKADEREKLFTGFFNRNQEAQITNLRFNVDNWIYASNHGQQGEVRFEGDPGSEPLNVSGADFRFRLDTKEFERETAPGQFGQAFDNYGRRFVTQNTIHIQEMVIPWRYLHRHPFMPSTRAMTNISDHDLRMYQLTDAPYWRQVRSSRRQAKYDEQGLDRTEHVDGHFTGASGGTFYGGDLFPEDFDQVIFTGEVAGNLVHRDVLVQDPDKVPFTAVRADGEKESEFIASTDPWFRPTNFTVGPDGALYLIDYYRQHIETPLSIPEDLKEEMDFLKGNDKGRIYRIVPKGTGKLSLDELRKTKTSDLLLSWLAHPNQWYRLQAQRLLLQAGDDDVLPGVEELAVNHDNGAVRVQALYLMEGLGGLTADHVKKALNDSEPGVREHALRLAESFQELLPDVIALKDDPIARVRMQVALSLGQFSPEKIISGLGDILVKDYRNNWMRMAVLSSEQGSSMAMMKYLDDNTDFFESWDGDKQRFVHDFTYITAARQDEPATLALINELARLPVESQENVWKGFAGGVKKSGKEVSQAVKSALAKSAEGTTEAVKKLITELI